MVRKSFCSNSNLFPYTFIPILDRYLRSIGEYFFSDFQYFIFIYRNHLNRKTMNKKF